MTGGTKQDMIVSMQRAAFEIRSLRKENDILNAQMHIVNVFAKALGFEADNRGMSEDVAWRLDKHIEAIEEDIKREKAETASKIAKPQPDVDD